MSVTSKKYLLKELKEKKFRAEYVASFIRTNIAHQIRAIREQRGWRQEDLANEAGKKPNGISRIESIDYGSFSLSTLLDIADAFDIALYVEFMPFSRFCELTEELPEEGLSADRFEHDLPKLKEWAGRTRRPSKSDRPGTRVVASDKTRKKTRNTAGNEFTAQIGAI